MRSNKPHHIVGVHALCLCNFEKITDFSHVTSSSRIVFHAFNFFNILIYIGYKINHIKNAIKAKIRILFNFTNIIITKKITKLKLNIRFTRKVSTEKIVTSYTPLNKGGSPIMRKIKRNKDFFITLRNN